MDLKQQKHKTLNLLNILAVSSSYRRCYDMQQDFPYMEMCILLQKCHFDMI